MWHIIIQKISEEGDIKMVRETLDREPESNDIDYFEKYYTTHHDPYTPQTVWDATVVNIFETKDPED